MPDDSSPYALRAELDRVKAELEQVTRERDALRSRVSWYDQSAEQTATKLFDRPNLLKRQVQRAGDISTRPNVRVWVAAAGIAIGLLLLWQLIRG